MLIKLLAKFITSNNGQSVIEILIALALFIIIAGGGIVTILGGFTTTRLAEEEAQATLYASQGIEAVQSIRNQDWDLITNGDHGLISTSSAWSFSGTSDNPDGQGKYIRVTNISEVQRDSNGNIATSGGTVDTETKLITVNVSWDFTPTRNNSVTLNTYLTNWQFGRSISGAGAPLAGTCNEYCTNQGFSSGSCEPVSPPCSNSGGTHKPPGDVYCTGSPSDTCCCL